MSDIDEGEVGYVGGGAPYDGHDRCRDEARRLRERIRRLERAAAWLPDEGAPLTDEHLRGIKQRWATGPEDLQQDADALIGAVLCQRARIAKLEMVAKAARDWQAWRDVCDEEEAVDPYGVDFINSANDLLEAEHRLRVALRALDDTSEEP